MTIKKWILFFLLAPIIYFHIVMIISFPLMMLYVATACLSACITGYNIGDLNISALIYLLFPSFVLSFFAAYLYAKFFGLFKYIDGLKMAMRCKIFCLALVSFVLFLILLLPYVISDNDLFFGNAIVSYSAFGLVPAFFLYKIVNNSRNLSVFLNFSTYEINFQKINDIGLYKKIIKIILFFILSFGAYKFLIYIIFYPIFLIVRLIYFITDTPIGLDDYFIIFCLSSPFCVFIMYSYAKIFGFFKIIDELSVNNGLKYALLVLSSVLLFLILLLPYKLTNNNSYLINCALCWHCFSLIPAFFIYKLLQHLTQKHPVPFRALAYYFSIEFYRTLIKNSYHKIKNKFTK